MSAMVGVSPWQNRPRRGIAGQHLSRARRSRPRSNGAAMPARSSSSAPSVLSQILQHPQIVQRMDVAGDGIGDLAHARAAERVRRQQRRFGHDLVEIFDDRQRLADGVAVMTRVGISSCGLSALVGVRVLLAAILQQMHEAQLGLEAFEVRARCARGTPPRSGNSCRA